MWHGTSDLVLHFSTKDRRWKKTDLSPTRHGREEPDPDEPEPGEVYDDTVGKFSQIFGAPLRDIIETLPTRRRLKNHGRVRRLAGFFFLGGRQASFSSSKSGGLSLPSIFPRTDTNE